MINIDKCKADFEESYTNNSQEAVDLLNDRNLGFPQLFILLPRIKSFNLYPHLNFRNTTAVGIANQILNWKGSGNNADYLSARDDAVHSTLKWILESGSDEDHLSDEYREILDIIISVLISTYKDKSILPIVDKMIFKRNKKGHNVHNLVWAFLQSHDIYALKLIAEHIRSSDREEADLACKLLNIQMTSPANNQKQYDDFLQWLEKNEQFLYFTDESFQFSSRPVICNIDTERKYSSDYNKQLEKDELGGLE